MALLSQLALNVIWVPSRVDEEGGGTPEERVLARARKKALAVAAHQEGIVIGADTLIVLDKKVLGKPSSRAHAKRMLQQLSGREHRVLTGLYVLITMSGNHEEACEETLVRFRNLEDEEIEAYLETGEYIDKAGSYAIQGKAALFVEAIRGDFFNVVGLPLCRLALLLKELGVGLLNPGCVP
jgi:septum formation protein